MRISANITRRGNARRSRGKKAWKSLKKKEEKSKKSELKRFIIDLILLSIRVDVIRSGSIGRNRW